jgi:AcrR family transcriptional regulator
MQETSARLTSVCRRLTAQRGLNGFTVEEVCDEVDISRRTFFNYFPSKDDAVLGAHPDEEAERFAAEFLARGSRGWDTVVDDLVDLVIQHFLDAGAGPAGHAEFFAAIEREPKLLLRFIGVTRERDRQAVALVARRESVAPDDPRAEAAVSVLSLLIRKTGERFHDSTNSDEFSTIFHDSLAALRAVLAPSSPRKGDL